MIRSHQTRAVAAFTLSAALLLAACNSDPGTAPTAAPTAEPTTETPTTTPEPTEEPTTLSEQDQHIQEAKDTVLEYNDVYNEVSNRGFEEWWEDLQIYWGHPDILEPESAIAQDALEAGEYTEGEIRITSMTALDYVEDPTNAGNEQVVLEFCSDVRERQRFNADGTPKEYATPGPDTFMTEVLMQHVNGERWTIAALDRQLERSC